MSFLHHTMKSKLFFLFALLFVSFARAADTTEALAPGVNVTLEAAADGAPAPTFEWFRNDVKIGEGTTLNLGPMDATKAGAYTVKATNNLGAAVSDKYILVLAYPPTKPTIKVLVSVTVTVTSEKTGTSSTTAANNAQ